MALIGEPHLAGHRREREPFFEKTSRLGYAQMGLVGVRGEADGSRERAKQVVCADPSLFRELVEGDPFCKPGVQEVACFAYNARLVTYSQHGAPPRFARPR